MTDTERLEATLRVASDVLDELRKSQIDAIVIGAMALAVHQYPRDTTDLDLAVATQPKTLHDVAEKLRLRGYEVEVRDPDANDPLGGVMDVRSNAADLVQVVNFLNPPAGGFPRLVTDAIVAASTWVPNSQLRVADPYHLIAFKLYAGGPKSKLDILELLDRNPTLSRSKLEKMCEEYRLTAELNDVLKLEEEA